MCTYILFFIINKIALANKWTRKIIPSCSNSTLITEKENISNLRLQNGMAVEN